MAPRSSIWPPARAARDTKSCCRFRWRRSFNYLDNDPGPQTLLTSLTPEQNLERLYWLMSRMQGYVGLAEAMGARFTASEPSFGPILRETAKRGLIFVDDGANPRSVAARIAGANNLPF